MNKYIGLLKIADAGNDSVFKGTIRNLINPNAHIEDEKKINERTEQDLTSMRSIPADVISFFDDIKYPMAQENKPGIVGSGIRWQKDTDGVHFHPFHSVKPNFTWSDDFELDPKRYSGLYRNGAIYINPNRNPEQIKSTLVHEMSHHLQQEYLPHGLSVSLSDGLSLSLPDFKNKGLTPEDTKKLSDAYGFTNHDTDLQSSLNDKTFNTGEEYATNSEYQFKVYQQLKRKLGRNPTYEEYKKHINNLSAYTLRGIYRDFPNGYIYNSVNRQGMPDEPKLEAFRKALLEVANNRSTYNNTNKTAEEKTATYSGVVIQNGKKAYRFKSKKSAAAYLAAAAKKSISSVTRLLSDKEDYIAGYKIIYQ